MEEGVKEINERVYMLAVPQAYGHPITASYLVRGEKTAIIEAAFGASVPDLVKAVEGTGVNPADVEYVFTTHSHLGHASGLGGLLKSCPNAKAVMHSGTSKLLTKPAKLVRDARSVFGDAIKLFEPVEPVPAGLVTTVGGGETFDLGDGVSLEIIRAPGHAPDHIAIYERSTKTLFPGDGVCMYSPEIPAFIPVCWWGPYDTEGVKKSLGALARLDLNHVCTPHGGAVPLDPKEFLEKCVEAIDAWDREISGMLERGQTYLQILEVCEEEMIARRAGYSSTDQLPEYFKKYWLSILPKLAVQGFMAKILWKF
jgi:glyoxylase-like metal-dependent hydrolase (beta-lactamase superfamily II)